MKSLRPDLIFSYWIYLWYVLYFLKIVSYSPKFALIIGLIDNIIMLLLMIHYGTSKKTIILFVIINTIIKIIPLYYLRHDKILLTDIYFTILLFAVFLIWIDVNKQTLVGNIKLMHDSLLYSKNNTPFIYLFNKIERNYKNMKIV